ncbi:Carboxylesterase NlhH [Cyphellophora attinorum]|uniref:Carboxylesterase NlhH n=1 Tax=Cyphellophora attinorum TaxID=1664694 RepID=A0A0N1HE04_9EURO|nr:Carboxylesterase NlhH [Phialophora attinorum]KPI42875.1 Carboxylesterase NlhH [Phialophora attinorum]
MNQTEVHRPKIADGIRYPWYYAIYLHTTAAVLRSIVSYISGRHEGFDMDLVVETPGLGAGTAKISVCLPPAADDRESGTTPKPLLLVAEGGGFVLGQPKDGRHIDRMISDETGAIVISVDYAKSPRYEYPHALLQLYEVLKWALSKEAQTKGIFVDPGRVAIMGNSAGGNLTAALTLLASFTAGPCAKFREDLGQQFRQVLQVLIYPSVRCNEPYALRWHEGDEKVREKSLPIWAASLMEASYLPPYVDKEQIFIAPLLADTALLKQLTLPPAVILTAGLDCLKYEAHAYGEKLREAGVQVSAKEYPKAIHGYSHYKKDNKDYRADDVEDTWKRVCEGLKTAFQE